MQVIVIGIIIGSHIHISVAGFFIIINPRAWES